MLLYKSIVHPHVEAFGQLCSLLEQGIREPEEICSEVARMTRGYFCKRNDWAGCGGGTSGRGCSTRRGD